MTIRDLILHGLDEQAQPGLPMYGSPSTRRSIMFIFLLLVLGLSIPAIAESQVACFDYGRTISCDGPRGNTSITEFSRGQGIINTDKETIPYSIIGQQEGRPSSAILPLRELDPLPSDQRFSYREERLSTFEERQAIRYSGPIAW